MGSLTTTSRNPSAASTYPAVTSNDPAVTADDPSVTVDDLAATADDLAAAVGSRRMTARLVAAAEGISGRKSGPEAPCEIRC